MQSNLYSVQIDLEKPLVLTVELERFLGVVFFMLIISLPNSRLHWSLDLAITQINQILSRYRFEQIKRFVHFNNNDHMLPPEHQKFDKLFKVRPLSDHLRKKYNDTPMSQMLCTDEQTIPFKGNTALKQYLPSKPHKCGYKVFILCSNKGVICDFEPYTGKLQPADDVPDLEVSSNLVLRLAKIISADKHYLLYFDNWPTTLPLVCHLAKSKIFCLGTVRSNRLPGCDFPSDKDMKKNGKGTHMEKESA